MSMAAVDDSDAPDIVEATETVTVPEPEETEDRGDAPQTPEERVNRKERRANRMREEKEAREAAERTAREAQERIQRMERETAELRGRVAAMSEHQQRGAVDDIESRVAATRRQAHDFLNQAAVAARSGDQEANRRFLDLYQDKIDEAAEIRQEAKFEARLNERLGAIQQQIMPPQLIAARDSIGREFPWLHGSAPAQAAVDAILDPQLAAGRPLTVEMMRAACAQVQRDFKLGGGGGQPGARSRQVYAAPGGGEVGGGDDDGTSYAMTNAEKKLAEATYRELPQKEAWSRFAKEIGIPSRKRAK